MEDIVEMYNFNHTCVLDALCSDTDMVSHKTEEDLNFTLLEIYHHPYYANVKHSLRLKDKECNVCFEKNKLYYIRHPYQCRHNNTCTECNMRMIETKYMMCCPVCRANITAYFNFQ